MSGWSQFFIFWFWCQIFAPLFVGMYALAFFGVYLNHTRKKGY